MSTTRPSSNAEVMWSAPFELLSIGQRFRTAERTVHETDVLVFSALSGDWHPQHSDADWAASSPFGERIAHGMLILSLAVGLVPLDPERVLALRRVGEVVFKRPLRLGQSMLVEGELTDLRQIDERSGLVGFAWAVRNGDGALVCRATLAVLWRGEGDAEGAREADAAATAWQEPIFAGVAPGVFAPVPL